MGDRTPKTRLGAVVVGDADRDRLFVDVQSNVVAKLPHDLSSSMRLCASCFSLVSVTRVSRGWTGHSIMSKRYASDTQWIVHHRGFSIEDACAIARQLIESRIIPRQSKQREDCFQKAVTKRGLRCMRRSARRARRLSCP